MEPVGADALRAAPARARLRWTPLEDEAVLPGFQERVTHPEFAGMEFVHVRAKSLLNHVPTAAVLPFDWTINVYRGCSHACAFCFARPTHTWLDLDADRDFERVIVVKVNAVEQLRAELRRPSWRGEHVALGTNTDPYQRAEGRYRLTRGVVTTLAEAGNPFSVLTKGTLVTRDLDVLAEAARRGVCTGVSLSIPTVDEHVWRLTESGAPHPRRAAGDRRCLRDAGIASGVMLAPIIPGLSDDEAQLRAAIAGALEAGATAITPIVLHLRPGVREVFLPRLRTEHPELADRLAATYRGANAPADVRRRIVGTVRRIVDELGGPRRSARHVDDGIRRPRVDPAAAAASSAGGEQLTLL
jgi:DNA repair photolyase